MADQLPDRGLVYWPVGNGDSTTVTLGEDVVLQVDLNDQTLEEDENGGDDDDSPYEPVVERLKELLPQRDGDPYLSTFVLTHPDKDHVLGFDELQETVEIGEIWHTPRIFDKYEDDNDLCPDAKAFREECDRRRKRVMESNGEVDAGDRVRVIGHDELFESNERYEDFPDDWKGIPGESLHEVDGENVEERFEAFIHAPFKDQGESERNRSSLALQVALHSQNEENTLKGLFFGDLAYATLERIIDKTREEDNDEYLGWHALLSPHHCSKKAMYQREDGEDILQKDPELLEELEEEQLSPAYIVASASPPFTDEEDSNPPHKKARNRYEERVESGNFLCTQQHGEEPTRIEFEVDDDGIHYGDPSDGSGGDNGNGGDDSGSDPDKTIGDAANETTERGSPSTHTGYGACK